MTTQFLLHRKQFRINSRKQVSARLNARRDKAEKVHVKVANFFHLFIGDLSFGEIIQ
jgi:hypothetical protein